MMIPLFKPNFDESEKHAIAAVMDSGWLSMGENVSKFEEEFSLFLGDDVESIATNSCTSSLYLAMSSLDLSPGDEVLVPALTFVADANIVRLCGAKPVFVDVVSDTDLNICVKDLESKITTKTAAIIVVHFAGFPCDMDQIMELARKHRLKVIEDCAHAPGTKYKGKSVGTIGDIGCFSFYSNKNLSTGEGGMLTTKNKETAGRLKNLRSHGMTASTLDRHKGRASSYDVLTPSLNFRFDEIRASIGRVQLAKLAANNNERRRMFSRYVELLSGSDILVPFASRIDEYSACHIMVVVLPETAQRENVISQMKSNGIQTSVHYPPFWTFSAYREYRPQQTSRFFNIAGRILTLPLSQGFDDSETKKISSSLIDATS